MLDSRKRIILYSLLIGACGIQSCASVYKVDKEIAPYYNSFMKLANQFCYDSELFQPRQIYVQFEKLDWPTVGQCVLYYNDLKFKIRIDLEYWKRLSIQDRETLIYHEASHCVVGMGHVNLSRHYMAPDLVEMKHEQLLLQTANVLKYHCNKWRDHAN